MGMNRGGHGESGLTKSVWSDADFEDMGWHDATIYGIAVHTDDTLSRLLLDLDYIVGWVHPVPPEKYFSFWVSPATLVFDEVWDLKADIDVGKSIPDLQIDDLHRVPADADQHGQPDWHVDGLRTRPRPIRRDQPHWHVEGHAFDIEFRASGYHQYIRREPMLIAAQSLSHVQRGGFAFTEEGFS